MINKTKLQFILGGILFVTFAVVGCNNGDADKDATKEIKTETPAPAVKDSMDSIPGNTAPTPGGGGS